MEGSKQHSIKSKPRGRSTKRNRRVIDRSTDGTRAPFILSIPTPARWTLLGWLGMGWMLVGCALVGPRRRSSSREPRLLPSSFSMSATTWLRARPSPRRPLPRQTLRLTYSLTTFRLPHDLTGCPGREPGSSGSGKKTHATWGNTQSERPTFVASAATLPAPHARPS